MSNENPTGISIEKRLQSLEEHLRTENPVLVEVVQSYRQLDRVGRRMGMLGSDASYATQIPWWPLISIMGTTNYGGAAQELTYMIMTTGTMGLLFIGVGLLGGSVAPAVGVAPTSGSRGTSRRR